MFDPQIINLQEHSVIYDFFYSIYPELKFWASVGGSLWVLFKGIQYIKEIRIKDLSELSKSVASMERGMKEQTSAIISELKELRADLRGFTNSFIVPVRARAKRK